MIDDYNSFLINSLIQYISMGGENGEDVYKFTDQEIEALGTALQYYKDNN